MVKPVLRENAADDAAIITVAAVVINPLANRHYDALADGGRILLLVAFGLHLVGQFALSFLRAEE